MNKSEKILIDNLKEKVEHRRSEYVRALYYATILKIADEIFPLDKSKLIDYNGLPALF
jgi:hypothetical protein